MRQWDEFLVHQEKDFGKETVDRWLRTLKVLRFDACNLFLRAEDSFQSSWFDEHIKPRLSTFVNGNNKQIRVHLEVAGVKASAKTKASSKKSPEQSVPYHLTFDSLDPSFSFESFIINEENLVAYKVLEETCNQLVQAKLQAMSAFTPNDMPPVKDLVNPVVIYGPSGAGKTHLLQAASQKLSRVGYKVIYVRADTFTDHVVKAIRAGSMSYFREIYRTVDALIVDDIQTLAKKNATQEEFFHTFNALHTLGKPIFLSSNACPEALQNIEPRLISRFVWGIVLPMANLGKKELARMIEKKAECLKYPLATRTSEFLAESFPSNPKSTVRALEALMLRSHLASKARGKTAARTALPVALVKDLLHDLIEKEKTEELSSDRILNTVSEYYGIPLQELLGKSKTQECVIPRQHAMYLCRQLLKYPYMKIGDLFHRDHSTVMSSIKQIEGELNKNQQDLIQAHNALKAKLS